jgi:hypothetical protein
VALAPCVTPCKPAGAARDALVAGAGWALSFALARAAVAACAASEGGATTTLLAAAAAGALLCLLGATASDAVDVARLLLDGTALQARMPCALPCALRLGLPPWAPRRYLADAAPLRRGNRPSAAATSACWSPPPSPPARMPWQSSRRASLRLPRHLS